MQNQIYPEAVVQVLMIKTYMQDMKNLYTILLLSTLFPSTQGCEELSGVFVNVTAGTVAQFDYGIVSTTGTITYEVRKSGQAAKLRLPYTAGVPGSPQANTGVIFTGNAATGHISFTYSGVVEGDKGTYILTGAAGTQLKCQTLYSLGETTADVKQVGTAKLGGNAKFQCNATSLTSPSRSGIEFTYRWKFGPEIDPVGDKYDIDGNSFTIKDITEADKSKTCSCFAKENVAGDIAEFSNESNLEFITVSGPECCCCCICCFIVLIVSVAIGILFTGGHIGLTWADHEYSVKKILSENNKTKKTTEAVCLKDYVIKAVLPECCICLVVIIVQIAVYFAALKKDCNEHCDDCCGVIICLVVTIIVSVVKDAIESGIIYLVVHVKGGNYIHQGGNVDKGDSACCRRNNSILPICAGDDQQPSDRPRDEDDRYQSDEPKSNTTNSASWRAQPPLPDIRSEKKNTSDINPPYEKKRLTPIGQESQPGWEEKTDRSEDGKEKKKKRKSKEKEKDSNITESADL